MSKQRPYPIMLPENDVATESMNIIKVDPFGSYTGCPLDQEEIPVQDADDL